MLHREADVATAFLAAAAAPFPVAEVLESMSQSGPQAPSPAFPVRRKGLIGFERLVEGKGAPTNTF
jgi:hypothetical protein